MKDDFQEFEDLEVDEDFEVDALEVDDEALTPSELKDLLAGKFTKFWESENSLPAFSENFFTKLSLVKYFTI